MAAKLTATGTVVADVIPPAFSLEAESSLGASGVVYPWDRLLLKVTEGVDSAKLAASMSSGRSVVWSALEAEPGVAWAGAYGFEGRLPGLLQDDTKIDLRVEKAVSDLAGNGSEVYESSLQVRGLGAAQTGFTFDDDAGPRPVSWAGAEVTYHGQKSGSDPRCEQGGCVMLRPSKDGPGAGIAGRLKPQGASKARIRYRIIAANEQAGPGYMITPFHVITAASNQGPTTTIARPSDTYHNLDPNVDGFHWATNWATHTVELPVGADDLGFAIAFSRSNTRCVAAASSLEVALIIDRIELSQE